MSDKSETVEVEGHLVDSLLLPKILDLILDLGGDYTIFEFELGRASEDMSKAKIEVRAADTGTLEHIVSELHVHGVNRPDVGEAVTQNATQDGVFPAGFYTTSNLPTRVWIDGEWHEVENPEMDCGLMVLGDGRVRSVPMHKVKSGDRIVVGNDGIRSEFIPKAKGSKGSETMDSELSPEKPKAAIIHHIAERIRSVKIKGNAAGSKKVVAVCGPAVIHTGAGPGLSHLIREGWIDVLFAGNGFATYDIESNVMGTALGVSLEQGSRVEGGHANHMRVINELRRYGSIAAAVEAGYIDSGVMYECITNDVPFVLAGSIRDDGPLPDTHSDALVAVDAMRYFVPDTAVALMLSSTLHSVATGNLLPATVEAFCVDISQAAVTKLSDRGSHQSVGVVTDVGLFVNALADELIDDGGVH